MTLQRIAGLDELRGLAILLVLMSHYWSRLLAPLPTSEPRPAPANPGPIAAGWYNPIDRGMLPVGTQVMLWGWAVNVHGPSVNPSGVDQVDVYLDGDQHLGTALLEFDETWDVAQVHGPRASRASWRLGWKAEGIGPHRLSVVATSQGERYEVAVTRFRVAPQPVAWPWGAIGVDLFFVISGFLITTILVVTRDASWTLAVFYARRALRILPLAWVVIALAAWLAPESRGQLWAYLLFVNNAQPGSVTLLSPMWSLAIEEQFYLVFPLVCLLVPPRWLYLAVGVLLGTFWAVHLMIPAGRDGALYWSYDWRTYSRASMILAGSWLALWRLDLVPRPKQMLGIFVAFTACLLAAGGQIGQLEVLILPMLVLLVYLAISERFVISMPVLRLLGTRCYGLYLLHLFVLHLLTLTIAPLPILLDLALYLGLTLGVAELSYRFLERPLLKLAPGYRWNRTPKSAPVAVPAQTPVG